jgi:hypothetical protein
MIALEHRYRIYSLVCEGRCNPRLHELDAAYRALRETTSLAKVVIPANLLDRTRALVHTPHEVVYAETVRCTVCGTERKY